MCKLETTAATKAPDRVATPIEATEQLARYKQKHGLPGVLETLDDEMLQYREVVVVVSSEAELQQWVRPTRPFQIELLGGVHEHGMAPGIADHIRYVVIRSNGAEGVIGGAPQGEVSPAADGWSLWVRFYPNGRTIFARPPADKDLVPGRENNILLPLRKGLRPETGSTLPHQQLTQLAPPDIRTAMRDWMDTSFRNVRTGPSLVSDHVTWAMHLDGLPLARTARILAPIPGASEFAHMHVDGSWHLSLPAEDRWEVLAKGWGTIHPVAVYGINALLFYAPRHREEFRCLQEAVVASYRYAIGEIR
jgi:phospholipase/carboxylesterase